MSLAVGLELNGFWDVAARDWQITGETGDQVHFVVGGAATDAVKVASGKPEGGNWIGGPQATLAPHGRGPGWGKVGDPALRRALAEALQFPKEPTATQVITAGLDALARGATSVMLTVPDTPEFDEARQGALLGAVARPRRRAQLVWRSVAAFHGLRKEALANLRAGDSVRLLLHGADGFEDQTLVLRTDPEHSDHSAPLREHTGRLVGRDVGLRALYQRARELVASNNPHIPWDKCEKSRLGPRLLTGKAKAGDVEIVRHQNGTWLQVAAPQLTSDALGINGADPAPANEGRRPVITVLATPMTPFADHLSRALGLDGDSSVIVDPRTVAHGALECARLIERGRPHYFDKLEPIAIAVMQQSGAPVWEALIGENEVVPANREYRSKSLEGFRWGHGKKEMEFYVLKGKEEVRHWIARRDEGPRNDTGVVLRLRQTPGQSWAKLTVNSLEWEALARNPIELKWEALAPLDKTPEEVLRELAVPPPEPPLRIVEEAHIGLWEGADWAGVGAKELLAQSARLNDTQLAKKWYDLLKHPRRHPATRERFWCVSTDGNLPSDLPFDSANSFDAVLGRLADTLVPISAVQPPWNNDPLLALTWAYTRCPEEIKEEIVKALEADAASSTHPFLEYFGKGILRQAAGRAVSGKDRLSRLFHYFAACNFNTDVTSGLGKAMARRVEAPAALSREIVETLAAKLAEELKLSVQNRNFKRRFLNTLLAMAALFRWREIEPYALVRHTDPVGARLASAVEETRELVVEKQKTGGDFFITEAIKLLDIILEHLEGKGDPNILKIIEQQEGL